MRVGLIGLMLFGLFAPPKAALVAPGLCNAGETRYFSCQTKAHKWIAICGQADRTIQYRFGKRGQLELRYPEAGQAALRYAHYFRYQVDRYEVSFRAGQTDYAVFDYFEGKQRQAGVHVTLADERNTEVRCGAAGLYSKLEKLADLLPCDQESALNMGTCPQSP